MGLNISCVRTPPWLDKEHSAITIIWTSLFSLHFPFWTAARALLRHFTLRYINSFGLLPRAVPKTGMKWGERLMAVGILYLKTSNNMFLPQTDFLCCSYAKFVKLHSQAKKRSENALSSWYNVVCNIWSNNLSLPKLPYTHIVSVCWVIPDGKLLCTAFAKQLTGVQPHSARWRRSCCWRCSAVVGCDNSQDRGTGAEAATASC